MVQHKAKLKKQQKRGVDFKKIKRKIGRKLPPPKNATNTEVKSKAIILPEQSVASDKAGLAVSKKGLTLKELLQQTSHHNAKVRRDALIGIRDILLKHPAELKLHRLSVIEKLRERISDDDKMVRETLYQLLKAVIFPACKEDNQGPFISLMMAYVFSAMTHLAIDVRLMAFKFLDLIVQHYPSSFSLYAEKILQHYKEILQKNQFNFHDKGKLKSILTGLAYCLSLLPCSRRDDNSSMRDVVADRRILHSFESDMFEVHSGFSATKDLKDLLPILIGTLQDLIPSTHTTMPPLEAQSFECVQSILKSVDLVIKFFVHESDIVGAQLNISPPSDRGDQAVLQLLLKKLFDVFPLKPAHLSDKDENRYFVLNVIVSEVFFCLSDWTAPPSALLEKFLEFLVNALSAKVSISVHSGKAFFQKHTLSLIPFIPKLINKVEGTWKSHILQAFTEVFKKCTPESSVKLACLSAIDEMLFPKHGCQSLNTSDSEYLNYQITWIRELPLLLILLGDKNPVSSKAVLHLQLHVGQCAFMNPSLTQEFDNMQYSFREFYSTCIDGSILYGPFMKLPRDIQEISVCCLYYLSFMDLLLLQSLVTCCLCQELEPFMLFRVLEVLESAYRAGHIQIADYISFLITLLSRYEVIPESSSLTMEKCGKSNSGTFKSVTRAVCSFLSQIGDGCLVFQMLEKAVFDQISNKPPMENVCALLRMLITLDSRPTKMSEESISELGNVLPEYLIGVVSRLSEEDPKSSDTIRTRKIRYYLLPCFLLFQRSNKLINLVLNVMRNLLSEEGSPAFPCLSYHSAADHSSRISAVVNVLLQLHNDVKVRQILLPCKEEIDSILQDILGIMSREGNTLGIEGRHRIQSAYDRLKSVTGG